MNRWIATFFAGIVGFLHLICLVGWVLSLTSDQWIIWGFQEHIKVLLHAGILVIYVITFGVISTFISINSYLKELVELGKAAPQTAQVMSGGIQAERIEPSISSESVNLEPAGESRKASIFDSFKQ